jgi:two-component system, NtrC family, nitrogen regulation sensor histidine kinase NtrY
MATAITNEPTAPFAAAPRSGDNRRLFAFIGVISVVSALVTAAVSFVILIGLTPIKPDQKITILLTAINGTFILLLMTLIGREILRIALARRHGKAASRLHIRIVTLFSIVAAVPAIVVAVVAAVTLNLGLDRWFELRTKTIVNSSISLANSYIDENARNLQGTTLSMAFDLDSAHVLFNLDRTGFERLMTQQAIGRGLIEASLLKSDGSVVVKADIATDKPLPPPPDGALQTASDGKPVLIPPATRNLVGAIVKMHDIPDVYLYTIRSVDPAILRTMRLMEANTAEYQGLEANRTNTQIAFAVLYFGLTLVVLLSAIWTGIAVADRLVLPVRLLIGAADDVASGNLEVSVPVRSSDGDVGSLSDTFNNMVAELKGQRNEILAAKDQVDERRRFTEAVLAAVTAGVIGVSHSGQIKIFNRSAETILGVETQQALGADLTQLLPEIGQVFEAARASGRPVYREQVTRARKGVTRTLNIRIAVEESASAESSYVVTLDDITDLVDAQRSSAWADVARRIAHEIKNPLTPIQLSAERIRRRYGKVITEDREVFDQCTDTIIRQVGDIGRMVDEFSSFARMPKPDIKVMDLRDPLREASFLVEVSRHDIRIERDIADGPLLGHFDSRLIGQAFGNVIKNAAEAIDAVSDAGESGHILIRARAMDGSIVVDILDNGKGLPKNDRQRLLEPYMTTREKGTGLGLAIVKKIVEEHTGRLELHDAPEGFHGGRGAMIRMVFPAAGAQQSAGIGA